MTLIIAGFERVKDPWAGAWKIAEAESSPAPIEMVMQGLFAVADSLITTDIGRGPSPLLSGMRKVHSIPIQLWKPFFVGGLFRDYKEVHYASQCMVAFAGSTLTATHALNSITEHLSMLRISDDPTVPLGVPNKYIVNRNCEYVHVRDAQGFRQFDDDVFLPSDFKDILTADYLAEVIEHSINVALKSAKKYRLDARAVELMKTDFVVGIQCPSSRQYRLFTFRMDSQINSEGILEVFAGRQEIDSDTVAVLGLRAEFEERAQAAYRHAIVAGVSPGKALFDFINIAIDEIASSGHVTIDRPSTHRHFEDGLLKMVSLKPAAS